MSERDGTDANERRQRYARAIWTAMVNDEPPPNDDTIWRDGYLDAADAVIALADNEQPDVLAEWRAWLDAAIRLRDDMARLHEDIRTLRREIADLRERSTRGRSRRPHLPPVEHT